MKNRSIPGPATLIIAFLVCTFSFTGCYREINVGALVCKKQEHICPKGFDCVFCPGEDKGSCVETNTDGAPKCEKGGGQTTSDVIGVKDSGLDVRRTGDGSSLDVPQSMVGMPGVPGTGGAGGTNMDDGGTVGLVTYDPSKVRNGDICALDIECGSGRCVEKVCCDRACGESCFACKQSMTGKPDGTCAPVGSGKRDPQDICKDEIEKNQCGNDGLCDGTGACRKIGTDHICKTSACEGTKFVPTSTCDGKGACKTVEPAECGAALCDRVDGCRKDCKDPLDCTGITYCNPATEKCTAKKIDGDSCKDKTECQSGFCIDGVCCKTECKDACKACSMVLTGQASGTCQPARMGTDPHESCADEPGCGNDGTCDGAGACRKRGTDSVCSPSSCSSAGNKYSFSAMCNGKGACQTPKVQDCGSILCDDKEGCATTCTTETDCASRTYCNKGTCAPKLVLGKPCVAANECASANCVEGVCCDGKCDSACFSCKKDLTGEKTDGVCATVDTGKKDSKKSCTDERPTIKCGQDGTCNGSGACKKVDKGIGCGESLCDANKFIAEATCDGAGKCSIPAAHDCGIYPCATTGCQTNCTTDKDCGGSTYCSAKKCVAKLVNGKACAAANACTSGNCVEGVCCKDATCPTCNSCKVAGKEGTCAAVAKGAKDANCSGTAPCGQNGTCDSGGKCFYPDSAVKCGATCSGWTLTDKTCSGDGFCSGLASSGKSCGGSLVCENPSVCRSGCTSDLHCVDGHHCSSKGTCEPKKGNGITCQSGLECTSKQCVDGVCCNTICAEICSACSNALTGKSSGTCSPVKGGTDPDNNCALDTSNSCGNDGDCNGAGACQKADNKKACSEPYCDNKNNYFSAAYCSGSGSCTPAKAQACGILICSEIEGCPSGCDIDTDCIGGYFCSSTKTCKPKVAAGKACVSNSECASGNCVGKICCNTPCPLTGACGNTGSCDGGGKCIVAPSSTICATASCSGNYFTPVSKCDGKGSCVMNDPTSCQGYACTTSGCKDTCAGDADCFTGNKCTINKTCGACGTSAGQYCCLNNICTGAESVCNTGTKKCEVACGGRGQRCCSGVCNNSADYCNGTTCAAKQLDGALCEANLECQSNNCSSGTCCRIGYMRCGSTCIPSGSCCTAADCPNGAPGTTKLCNSNNTCSWSCATGYKSCGSVCIQSDSCCAGGTEGCPVGSLCQEGKCEACSNVYYRDSDGDSFGYRENSITACSMPIGYATNASDCDDTTGNIKPSSKVCKDADVLQTCGSNGVFSVKTCDFGCLNSDCRTDGTIGKKGLVTCFQLVCSTSEHCSRLDTRNPQAQCSPLDWSQIVAGEEALDVSCDGPNDCPSTQVCCAENFHLDVDAVHQRLFCTTSNACNANNSSTKQNRVCDYMAPVCPSGTQCEPWGTSRVYACQ